MKKILLCLLAAIALMACNSNSYSNLLKAEKKRIENYMSRNGYYVLDTLPADGVVWDEKAYYRVPSTKTDYCFYHLTQMGDTSKAPIKAGERVVIQFRQYDLLEQADTISYWTSLDFGGNPIEFDYYTDATGTSCPGWQLAIGLMKYPNTEAKIIVPSKLGFSTDQTETKTYGYDLKFKIKR